MRDGYLEGVNVAIFAHVSSKIISEMDDEDIRRNLETAVRTDVALDAGGGRIGPCGRLR